MRFGEREIPHDELTAQAARIATALIAATGFTLAPAFYIMLAAAAAGIAAFLMADRSREKLP